MSMNLFVVALISAIVAIVLYIINNKIEKDELSNKNMIKTGMMGASLGLMSALLMTFGSETSITLDQDIMTGTPNF
tara:strand:- start:6390 stop:6617 length:228 start_codon:yes stop_codon:yes gene_type:complete